MAKKRTFNFWIPQEDKSLIKMKLEGLSTKKIIHSLEKLNYAKRTDSSVNTRCSILKNQYQVQDYQELLQKLGGDIKSKKVNKEDGLKEKFNRFYEKEVSPYMKKYENFSVDENPNPFNKYLPNKYIVLEIKKIDKKLNNREKNQLEKILGKLDSGKIKNIEEFEKIEKTKKTKNYHYPLPDLTPSEIREKILEMKKQNLTNDEIYEAFPKKIKQSIGAYLSHFTRGSYQKRNLV